ncbi:PadR family transcriptional regulator [Arthrobacter sp. 260]|uniref:PadR family transcriptional regulator n=1 Tax=Arthrobacter sp. 260 TaxID=2735314 RepID=UPI001491E3AE|nr:PadR family transcriptional regulator [Arthrobacter sp. 260]NOJ60206.1 PadR family transcriptional regulator [Arthrobacter sp. 260]
MSDRQWPSEWMRGVLGMSVLKVLESGPTYGYAIAAALEEAGLGSIKGGTLYPLLTRFESAQLVTTEWRAGDGGPGRKYFSLTDAGRAELAQQTTDWQAFTTQTLTHLNGAPNDHQ